MDQSHTMYVTITAPKTIFSALVLKKIPDLFSKILYSSYQQQTEDISMADFLRQVSLKKEREEKFRSQQSTNSYNVFKDILQNISFKIIIFKQINKLSDFMRYIQWIVFMKWQIP